MTCLWFFLSVEFGSSLVDIVAVSWVLLIDLSSIKFLFQDKPLSVGANKIVYGCMYVGMNVAACLTPPKVYSIGKLLAML